MNESYYLWLSYERCICWTINYDEISLFTCYFLQHKPSIYNIRYPYGEADCELCWKQLDQLCPWLCSHRFMLKHVFKNYKDAMSCWFSVWAFQGHIRVPFLSHLNVCKSLGETTSSEFMDWIFSVSFLYFGNRSSHIHLLSPLWGCKNIWRVTRMAVWADVIG